MGQVEREGRLPELLEDRAMGLVLESDLDELLLDRRGAFDGARLDDVVYEGPRDRLQVDPAVGSEALVLDRDDRVLDDHRDLGRFDQELVLLAQDADRVALVVQQERVARVLELGRADGLFERGEFRCDGHEHPEHERDQAQQQDRCQDRQEAQPLQAGPPPRRRGRKRGRRTANSGWLLGGCVGAPAVPRWAAASLLAAVRLSMAGEYLRGLPR